MIHVDPGVILIVGMIVLGLLAGGLTILIGYIKNPPRKPGWRQNPTPGRGPYWDAGRSWSDLVARGVLVGVATMFFIIPGILMLAMGGTAARFSR